MSEELLSLLTWLAILFGCAFTYQQGERLVAYVSPVLDLLSRYLLAYVGGALLVLLLFVLFVLLLVLVLVNGEVKLLLVIWLIKPIMLLRRLLLLLVIWLMKPIMLLGRLLLLLVLIYIIV